MVEIKITGIDRTIANLQALPREIVSKRGGPAYKSLRKGARVIHKEARANLVKVTSNATKSDSESTGLLLKSLIVTRGKPPSSGKGERALVRFSRRVYTRAGEKVNTRSTAAWLEYGTGNQPAEPFLRPAFFSKAEAAIETTRVELLKEIDALQRKLGT